MKSKLWCIVFALLATSLAAGCTHTAEGAGKDIEQGGQSIQHKAENSRNSE